MSDALTVHVKKPSRLRRAWYKIRYLTYKPADHPLGFVVAVAGAMMQMMSYGIDNAFSTYSTDMQKDPTLHYPSATLISLGNSISLGLSPVVGILAGFLVDRVAPSIMFLLSTVMLFLGLWLSSSCAHSGIAVVFSYSLLACFSSAFMLSPGSAATSSWFNRRQGLAQGINFCGGGIGSSFIPVLIGQWVGPYGWRKTFRIVSCFCAIGLVATPLSWRRNDPDTLPSHIRAVVLGEEKDDENQSLTQPSSSEEKNVLTPHGSRVAAHGQSANEPTTAELEMNAMHKATEGSGVVSLEDDGAALPQDRADNAVTLETGAAKQRAAAAHGTAEADSSMSPKEGGVVAVPHVVHSQTPDPLVAEAEMPPMTPHEALMHALHTRHLTGWETVRVMLTVEFLANFFMFLVYGFAFYGLIYVNIPYITSIGVKGTVYEHYKLIGAPVGTTISTINGALQIVGSILIGATASFTEDALAYSGCSVVGGIACICLIFCRGYIAFAFATVVIGFCTAGMFAVMPALIAKNLYGPNLGFFMSCVFVAGAVGGLTSPPIEAELQSRHHGNYSYGCLLIAICMIVPGIICYIFLWKNKQGPAPRLWRALLARLRRQR